jgi:hypothetical protein
VLLEGEQTRGGRGAVERLRGGAEEGEHVLEAIGVELWTLLASNTIEIFAASRIWLLNFLCNSEFSKATIATIQSPRRE